MDFLCVLQLLPKYKIRANWNDNTHQILNEHWNYLLGLHAEGKVKFVARTNYEIDNDANRGLAVYVADSEEQAQEMMMNDPCLQGGIMKGEIHPLLVFMLGKEIVNL